MLYTHRSYRHVLALLPFVCTLTVRYGCRLNVISTLSLSLSRRRRAPAIESSSERAAHRQSYYLLRLNARTHMLKSHTASSDDGIKDT